MIVVHVELHDTETGEVTRSGCLALLPTGTKPLTYEARMGEGRVAGYEPHRLQQILDEGTPGVKTAAAVPSVKGYWNTITRALNRLGCGESRDV